MLCFPPAATDNPVSHYQTPPEVNEVSPLPTAYNWGMAREKQFTLLGAFTSLALVCIGLGSLRYVADGQLTGM